MPKKQLSKRLKLRKKHKILRKIREHNRKVRKCKKTKKKGQEDERIPNNHPFKLQLLQEMKSEHEKTLKIEKEARKPDPSEMMEKLAKKAMQSAIDYEKKVSLEKNDTDTKTFSETSLKSHSKDFKKIVQECNIVIEVLDARDPLGSRSEMLEKEVMAHDSEKMLLLLLNKIDLVPKATVIAWLQYLRNEYPTIAFKSCTQPNKALYTHATSTHKLDDFSKVGSHSSVCIGAKTLINYLKHIYRVKGSGTALTVGFVGFPNVGKSSVINSLKREKVCKIGCQPGVTTSTQEVRLDQHIRCLDSPGVMFPTQKGHHQSPVTIISNCIKNQEMKNPSDAVETLLSYCDKSQLMTHFGIPQFDSFDDFLAIMAKRFGKLKKGGLPDRNAISKIILRYWTSGKIRYYMDPPSLYHPQVVNTKVVSTWKPEFDINKLCEIEAPDLEELTDTLSACLRINPYNSDPLISNKQHDQNAVLLDINPSAASLDIMNIDEEKKGSKTTLHSSHKPITSENGTVQLKEIRQRKKTNMNRKTNIGVTKSLRKLNKERLKKQRKEANRLVRQDVEMKVNENI